MFSCCCVDFLSSQGVRAAYRVNAFRGFGDIHVIHHRFEIVGLSPWFKAAY